MASAVEVVEGSLDAYNARDLPTFLSFFHPDIRIFEIGALCPSSQGLAQVTERYRVLFDSSPSLHCSILHRAIFPSKVVDHEHITGRMGCVDPVELVAIYYVEGGKITRVDFVR